MNGINNVVVSPESGCSKHDNSFLAFADSLKNLEDGPVGVVNSDLNLGYGINGSTLINYVLLELEMKQSLNLDYLISTDYLGYDDFESFEKNTFMLAKEILIQNPDFDRVNVVALIAETYKTLADYQNVVALELFD